MVSLKLSTIQIKLEKIPVPSGHSVTIARVGISFLIDISQSSYSSQLGKTTDAFFYPSATKI